MKTIKKYGKFSETYRLNENLLKKAWSSVVNFFKKKYADTAWLYYALFLKKNNELPKEKVEIYVPDGYGVEDVPTVKDVEMATEALNTMKESKIYMIPVNEEVISLEHPDPKIRNVDVEELKSKIIRVYKMNEHRVKEGKPRTKNNAVFIWGAPGIGKTEILRQVADELGCVVQEWHLSQIEPTDFRGIPKIENIKGSGDPRDERTVTKLPSLFPTDNGPNGKGGIMFFDEMNRAPKMVLSAALSLALSGTIGDYTLPDYWIVIAAGNRQSDLGSAGATTIEPALANRFAHVNYAPKLKSWMKWATTRPNMNQDIVAFLEFDSEYFHKLDPDEEPAAWASPRSWEMASDEDYAARNYDWTNEIPLKEMQDIYTDYVGADAALKFMGYLELKKFYNERDVENVFKLGAKAKPLPKHPHQAFAASASIGSYKKGQKLTVKELENFWEFVLSIKDLETRTPLISYFHWVHPEVKTEEPWKTITWANVKKWHIELQDLEKNV